MTNPRNSRRAAAALAATVAVGGAYAASAPAASAAKLKVGIYDCSGSTGSYYYNSVRIMTGGRYEYASARKGRKLVRPTRGRFTVVGKKIRWTSGTYKRNGNVSTIYGRYFSIDRKSTGVWTGISCYHVPRPTGSPGAQ